MRRATSLLTIVTLLSVAYAATPMSPVRIYGSYGFTFDGRGIMMIEGIKLYDNLFTKLYVKTPLEVCEGAEACSLYYEGIMNFYPALGTLEKFMEIKFKVLTNVPPRYAALKDLLGETAEKLFVMCTVIPRPEVASATVAGSVAKFLALNMRTFYFFALAPYNVELRKGDTVTMTYFISTSPSDVSLYGRRMIAKGNPCPLGSPYYAPVPDVYNFGGITNITMQWGWSVPNALKPVGYWDFPRPAYYVFTVKGAVGYAAQGGYTSNRGPSGLITVQPMIVSVGLSAYPTAPFSINLPPSYVGAVMQSFEVTFARKCPGDVDLDGKYTMKDFEVVACMTNLITNRKYCNVVINNLPPQLKEIFSMTGDVDQNGVVNQNDALVLLSYVGTDCPAADYASR